MRPSTDKEKRARKGKACILTALAQSCERAELVTVEGIELKLCPKHRALLKAIVYDAKVEDARQQRLHRRAA